MLRRAGTLLAVALLCACSDELDVSGLWQMPEDAKPISLPAAGREGGPSPPLYVKLAAGQYGWDVSGVLVLFLDPLYYETYGCGHVLEGKIRKGHFLFSVKPDNGGATLQADLVLADRDGRDVLEGTLTPEAPPQAAPVAVQLELVGNLQKVHEEGWDLGCRQE